MPLQWVPIGGMAYLYSPDNFDVAEVGAACGEIVGVLRPGGQYLNTAAIGRACGLFGIYAAWHHGQTFVASKN